MGAIIKDGINYSMGALGGDDNSEIISYEDYQNLSDEEKNSDTTYYIPDYPDEEGGTVEVVDNLESTDTDKALSANMGNVIKNMLGDQVTFSLNGTTLTITTK